MEIKDIMQEILQKVIMPELSKIKDETAKIFTILDLTNKRMDDMNGHLVDLSRRIDEANTRIDEVRSELGHRIDQVRLELGNRIDETNREMSRLHADLINRLDANNERIDSFFLTSVSKEDHRKLDDRLSSQGLSRDLRDSACHLP